MRNLLHDDQDMPDEPPSIVQTVVQQMPTPQATKSSLNCTWNVMQREQSRRMQMAQPAWKMQMQQTRQTQQSSQGMAPQRM